MKRNYLLVCLLLTLCLTACAVKTPPSVDVETTRPTTATSPTVPSAEGEWCAKLSADALLKLAKEAPSALTVLGEDNVEKLSLAATLLGEMETEATLTVLLRLQNGNAEWILPHRSMEQAADTVLKEYNPLLAALLLPQVSGYLPPDITVPAAYAQTGEQLSLTVGDSTLTLSLRGDGLTVDSLTSTTLADADARQLEETLRLLIFLRNCND